MDRDDIDEIAILWGVDANVLRGHIEQGTESIEIEALEPGQNPVAFMSGSGIFKLARNSGVGSGRATMSYFIDGQGDVRPLPSHGPVRTYVPGID